jgi:cardiolipin synthase C
MFAEHWQHNLRHAMASGRVAMLMLVLALGSACTSKQTLSRMAEEVLVREQAHELACPEAGPCTPQSALLQYVDQQLALALESSEGRDRHVAVLLEDGKQALLWRLHLIAHARHSIEMQSFIFVDDESGELLLKALLDAARRGVRVRLLFDQLFSLDNRKLLARLARAHRNFALRVYNPLFDEASTSALDFAAGIVCCFRRLNHRAHNKLLLVDGRYALLGGRNVQDRYFDRDPAFNFRDRDVFVAGPEGKEMGESFERFWNHEVTHRLTDLKDVASRIIETHDGLPLRFDLNPQSLAWQDEASSGVWIGEQIAAGVEAVDDVRYFSNIPNKAFERAESGHVDPDMHIGELIRSAEHSVHLQTPYLVLSRSARAAFSELRTRSKPPRVRVSTNSLASTDAFPVYALSHKHRRRHLKELGFEILEYKPWPGRSDPVFRNLAAGKEPGSGKSDLRPRGSLPLARSGARRGMHAKSLLVDGRISLIGSHNFDPRSQGFNTENGVIIEDAEFAQQLREGIEADMHPDHSWVVAKKPDMPFFTPFNQGMERLSEGLPLFDIWPWRYATSYDLLAHCQPLPPDHPGFHSCYVRVGDFPEVNASIKGIYTRIVTSFASGLKPIL